MLLQANIILHHLHREQSKVRLLNILIDQEQSRVLLLAIILHHILLLLLHNLHREQSKVRLLTIFFDQEQSVSSMSRDGEEMMMLLAISPGPTQEQNVSYKSLD